MALVLVLGKKYPETGVILESEFCMVQNPCLSKSHTKFGLQDHPCFRILLAWDKYHFFMPVPCTSTVIRYVGLHKLRQLPKPSLCGYFLSLT